MTDMRFGAELRPDGVTFRLWAPAAKGVDVMLGRAHPMQALASGWYEATIPGLGAGTLYKTASMAGSRYPTRPRISSRAT
jgi:maltooligosyltrehalose trehalohydrolase